MRVLALEPFYGGSHRAFIDGWIANSRHDWTLLSSSPHHWKWRMRHSALTFAEEVRRLAESGKAWDIIFCTDMLNVAELRGFLPDSVAHLPIVCYYHENQLTYPNQTERERDLHFGLTNIISAIAADAIWFNTDFHRRDFFQAVESLLTRMPDYRSLDKLAEARAKARTAYPGVNHTERMPRERNRPCRLLWAARWEHDKNPEAFFEVLETLISEDLEFEVSVIGEQFSDIPDVFHTTRAMLGKRVVHWGYQKSREQYEQVLGQTNFVVSTANHEFFGISTVEAILAGAWPVLPNRLAYPELVGMGDNAQSDLFLYDGSVEGLTERLRQLVRQHQSGSLPYQPLSQLREGLASLTWPIHAPRLDKMLSQLI